MNIGQDQALRSIALTIPSSIRAEVNLLNMAFFLLSIQLLVRNSHLKRWTRPMRRDLIVKLLFVVAEPAQIGLQMVLAITTFTGLLHNCFRTRPCINRPTRFAACGDPTETRTHDFWLERPASCPIRR